MSLIKFNKTRFPWITESIPSWLDTNDIFVDDFFIEDKKIPAMNVKETKDTFEIELAVPGFSKNEIEVTLEDDLLMVFAEKTTKDTEKEKGYTRKEFTYNHFERRIPLPMNIDQTQKIKAMYKHGILIMTLAKKEMTKEIPKKIIEIA